MARSHGGDSAHTIGREWAKGVITGTIALSIVGLGRAYGKISRSPTHAKVIAWTAALGLVIAGAYAIRHLSRAAGRSLARRTTEGTGAILRLTASGVGYVILIFALFTVLGVSLSHLLIGAGLAGIILGIAGQQSLGNIFAAIVMMFARPFVVGDDIRIRSGALGGVFDVKVLGIGLTYVTVRSEDGILKIPNSAMLAADVGRPSPSSAPPGLPPTREEPKS